MYTLPSENLTKNQQKWLNHYYKLMLKNQNTIRVKGETARHHIVPESFFINRSRNKSRPGFLKGNPNDKSNLINLTHRQHFIAHQLLAKIYPQNQAMILALHYMRTSIINNSKQYDWAKRAYSKMLSSYNEEVRNMYKKIGEAQKGNKNIAKRVEVREKISKSLTGKKASSEAIQKNSQYRKGKNKLNYEPIRRMSETMSKVMTGKTKENCEMRRNHSSSLSKSMTGKTKETCPRLAAAAKTLSESMRKIKLIDRLKIVNMIDSENKTFQEVHLELSYLNASLKQIKEAYKKQKLDSEFQNSI